MPHRRAGRRTRGGPDAGLKRGDPRKMRKIEGAYGKAMLELRARKKLQALMVSRSTPLVQAQWQTGTTNDPQRSTRPFRRWNVVPGTKLCAWFGVPRRTVYYKPTMSLLKLDDKFVQPNQSSDRRRAVLWLSHRCLTSRVQQEHCATHLSNQRLEGSQARHWRTTACGAAAISRAQTQ